VAEIVGDGVTGETSPIRILWADDEVGNFQDTWVKKLIARGWEVETASTVRECLDTLRHSEPFDVLIVDMVMAEGDEAGLSIIDAVNASDHAIHMVVFTAFPTEATAFPSGRKQRVARYLRKSREGMEELESVIPDLAARTRKFRQLLGVQGPVAQFTDEVLVHLVEIVRDVLRDVTGPARGPCDAILQDVIRRLGGTPE